MNVKHLDSVSKFCHCHKIKVLKFGMKKEHFNNMIRSTIENKVKELGFGQLGIEELVREIMLEMALKYVWPERVPNLMVVLQSKVKQPHHLIECEGLEMELEQHCTRQSNQVRRRFLYS